MRYILVVRVPTNVSTPVLKPTNKSKITGNLKHELKMILNFLKFERDKKTGGKGGQNTESHPSFVWAKCDI